MLCSHLSSSHPINMVGHTALRAWQIYLILCIPYMVGRGLVFQVLLHPVAWLTLNLMGIKAGDSCVGLGHQVDGFTDTWSEKYFLLTHTLPKVHE